MDGLLFRRQERHYPGWLYDLVLDMFAVVQHWQPEASGARRGRVFESILYEYCDYRQLPICERSGARTIRNERTASGFFHETDGVIGSPDLTVHLELKHLTTPLDKNQLLVFNGKGLDHLLGGSVAFRQTPMFRMVLSGGILTEQARRFALQWGIIVVEPDRLPLLTVHQLAGYTMESATEITVDVQDEIWNEVPALLVPVQARMRRLVRLLDSGEEMLGEYRLDRAINYLQRVVGDTYWIALDGHDPHWLEARYERLSQALRLDAGRPTVRPAHPSRLAEPRSVFSSNVR